MVQSQNRLGFHIDRNICIIPICHKIDGGKKESLQCVPCCLAFSSTSIEQHPVDMLSCTVVPSVFCVPELIGVAMQGPGGCYSLICPSPVHHIHEIGFDPTLDYLRRAVESRKPLRMF